MNNNFGNNFNKKFINISNHPRVQIINSLKVNDDDQISLDAIYGRLESTSCNNKKLTIKKLIDASLSELFDKCGINSKNIIIEKSYNMNNLEFILFERKLNNNNLVVYYANIQNDEMYSSGLLSSEMFNTNDKFNNLKPEVKILKIDNSVYINFNDISIKLELINIQNKYDKLVEYTKEIFKLKIINNSLQEKVKFLEKIKDNITIYSSLQFTINIYNLALFIKNTYIFDPPCNVSINCLIDNVLNKISSDNMFLLLTYLSVCHSYKYIHHNDKEIFFMFDKNRCLYYKKNITLYDVKYSVNLNKNYSHFQIMLMNENTNSYKTDSNLEETFIFSINRPIVD